MRESERERERTNTREKDIVRERAIQQIPYKPILGPGIHDQSLSLSLSLCSYQNTSPSLPLIKPLLAFLRSPSLSPCCTDSVHRTNIAPSPPSYPPQHCHTRPRLLTHTTEALSFCISRCHPQDSLYPKPILSAFKLASTSIIGRYNTHITLHIIG